MTDSRLPVGSSGEYLDTQEVTTDVGAVHREVVIKGSPTLPNALQEVDEASKAARGILYDANGNVISSASAAPAADALGLVTRSPAFPIAATTYIDAYLLNGGSNDMAVNGGTTPVEFTYTASGDSSIGRLMVYLGAAGNMSEGEFADFGAALTNGIDIVCNGTTLVNWKDNVDIQTTMFDFVDAGAAFGRAGKVLTGRWTFYKADDAIRGLALDDGDVFKAVVNDDLSSNDLTIFRTRIQGVVL